MILMKQHNQLENRQISLLILIGIAILLPLVSKDIRYYFDSGLYLELSATLGLTSILFFIIVKLTKSVFPRRYKYLYTQECKDK